VSFSVFKVSHYTLVMNLILHEERYAICRLNAAAPLPTWARGKFVSLSRTQDELSVVCVQDAVPSEVKHENDWRVLQVEGPMDLAVVGVLASLTQPLADAGINLFAISTFDTDYLLVKAERLGAAQSALERAGHTIR
jgi:uncharacterized protein